MPRHEDSPFEDKMFRGLGWGIAITLILAVLVDKFFAAIFFILWFFITILAVQIHNKMTTGPKVTHRE